MTRRRPTYVRPARSSIKPALVTGAVIGALIGAAMLPGTAHAATAENDLRGFCSHSRVTACVVTADDDEGVLTIRDARGHDHRLTTPRKALSYLRHHAPVCAEEDSPRCYWDAGHRGNGAGESFLVTGGHAEGEGAVFYLGNLS